MAEDSDIRPGEERQHGKRFAGMERQRGFHVFSRLAQTAEVKQVASGEKMAGHGQFRHLLPAGAIEKFLRHGGRFRQVAAHYVEHPGAAEDGIDVLVLPQLPRKLQCALVEFAHLRVGVTLRGHQRGPSGDQQFQFLLHSGGRFPASCGTAPARGGASRRSPHRRTAGGCTAAAMQ